MGKEIESHAPEKANTAYVQFLVDVEDYTLINGLVPQVEEHLLAEFPDIEVYAKKFLLGPGSGGKIQIRFSGPDPNALRGLAEQATAAVEAPARREEVLGTRQLRVGAVHLGVDVAEVPADGPVLHEVPRNEAEVLASLDLVAPEIRLAGVVEEGAEQGGGVEPEVHGIPDDHALDRVVDLLVEGAEGDAEGCGQEVADSLLLGE